MFVTVTAMVYVSSGIVTITWRALVVGVPDGGLAAERAGNFGREQPHEDSDECECLHPISHRREEPDHRA